MEETHQDVLLKLREDMRREEEKHISRAVADVRSVEEEKQEALMKDLQQKEQERIKAAVDTERKIMESQYGSVTQLQQVSLDMKLVLSVVPCLPSSFSCMFALCIRRSYYSLILFHKTFLLLSGS